MPPPYEERPSFASQVERLFHAVADLPEDRRHLALSHASVDAPVAAEVRALLDWSGAESENERFNSDTGEALRMQVLGPGPVRRSGTARIAAAIDRYLRSLSGRNDGTGNGTASDS